MFLRNRLCRQLVKIDVHLSFRRFLSLVSSTSSYSHRLCCIGQLQSLLNGILCVMRIPLLYVFVHGFLVEFAEGLVDAGLRHQTLVVDDALGLVHVARVAVEAVHARLQCLLNHVLLDDEVCLPPLLNQICHQRRLAVVDPRCGTPHALPNDLQDVLGCANTISLRLAFARASNRSRHQLLAHVIIYEVLRVKNRDCLLLHYELESAWVRIDQPILGVRVLDSTNVDRGWHEQLHPVLGSNLTHLLDRPVTWEDHILIVAGLLSIHSCS